LIAYFIINSFSYIHPIGGVRNKLARTKG